MRKTRDGKEISTENAEDKEEDSKGKESYS